MTNYMRRLLPVARCCSFVAVCSLPFLISVACVGSFSCLCLHVILHVFLVFVMCVCCLLHSELSSACVYLLGFCLSVSRFLFGVVHVGMTCYIICLLFVVCCCLFAVVCSLPFLMSVARLVCSRVSV